MKRVDFDPSGAPGSTGPGGRNIQNRGVSKYVRISWDEALDIVTGEMNRMKETYGATAILYQNDQHGENKTVHGPHGCGRKLLDLFGGYTHQVRNADSWEGWYWGAKHVWGCEYIGQQLPQKNLLYDISKNAELLLFWGCDPETTPWGWGGQLVSRFNYWWSELGISRSTSPPTATTATPSTPTSGSPSYPTPTPLSTWPSPTAGSRRAPTTRTTSRPTPTAWTSSRPTSWATKTGCPRRPEWAAPITGVPARIIKALADEWASKRTTIVISNGGPAIRGPYSTEPARLQALCLAMQGLGKPGLQPGQDDRVGASASIPENQAAPSPRVSSTSTPPTAATARRRRSATPASPRPWSPSSSSRARAPGTATATACAATAKTSSSSTSIRPTGASKIHMIWTDSPSWITCWNDGNNFIRALRHPDIEFVMCQHPWIENDALFADVLLPVNTKLEEDDIGSDVFSGQMDMLYPEPRCMESLGESCSDYEVVCKIAERLGLLEEYTGGMSVPEIIRDRLRGVLRCREHDHLGGAGNEKGYYVVPPEPGLGEHPRRLHRVLGGPGRPTRSRPPPASWSSTPPAWPSTSPTTPSGRRCRNGSPRVSPTRRPSGPSGARSIRCWS